MFMFHIAQAVNLMALTGGVFLYVWGMQLTSCGKCTAKFFGLLVMVFSILSLLCSGYYGMKHWRDYDNNMMMHQTMIDKSKTTMPVEPKETVKKSTRTTHH